MKIRYTSETDFDEMEFAERPRRKQAARRQGPAPIKQSYERSQDVQRWLHEQAEEHASTELEFNPSFLASRRDGFWVLSSLKVFYLRGLISDVISQASSGKEATVYCCRATPASDSDYLAAKVYRPRMFRSLSNDAVYRESRAQYDGSGKVVRGERAQRINRKSKRGRAEQVANWIAHEFRVQQALYAIGADVPRPVAQVGNAVLMEYIGDEATPAPRLHDVVLDAAEAQHHFVRLIHNIGLFLDCHCIHGDLSAYNVLYRPGQVTIIDLAQAVDPRHNLTVYPLLQRDVARIVEHFAPYGIKADAEAIAAGLWERYLVGQSQQD